MINVSELKKKFDRLPVSKENWELYLNLLSLDQSVYKPLIEEIIEGRMDIEDTRPIFAKYYPKIVDNFRKEVTNKRMLINTPDELKQNLLLRAEAPDQAIKEVSITNFNYEDVKHDVITAYEQESGSQLTDNERKALLIALNEYEKTDIDLYSDKSKQTRLSDLISGSPS